MNTLFCGIGVQTLKASINGAVTAETGSEFQGKMVEKKKRLCAFKAKQGTKNLFT